MILWKGKNGWESLENWKGENKKMSSVVKWKTSGMNNTGKQKQTDFIYEMLNKIVGMLNRKTTGDYENSNYCFQTWQNIFQLMHLLFVFECVCNY